MACQTPAAFCCPGTQVLTGLTRLAMRRRRRPRQEAAATILRLQGIPSTLTSTPWSLMRIILDSFSRALTEDWFAQPAIRPLFHRRARLAALLAIPRLF